MACHTPPLKKKTKSKGNALPILSQMPSLNSTFSDWKLFFIDSL